MPLLSLVVAAALLKKQDIPKGVVYKKAPDSVNALAKKKLTDFFEGDPATVDFAPMGSKAIICMPGLWNNIQVSLKDKVPAYMIKAPKANFMLPTPEGVHSYEGRILRTDETQEFLWICLLAMARHGKPTIRKANTDEIKYYWATISYDIEEPVFVADFGNHHELLFDFDGSKTDPRVWVVDIIGGMKK